jgi:hypothetical protein
MLEIVHIRWYDSASIHGWRGIEKLKQYRRDKLMVIDSVGMLVHKSKEKVILIRSVGAGEVDGVFEIPRACIKSMKVLCKLKIDVE